MPKLLMIIRSIVFSAFFLFWTIVPAFLFVWIVLLPRPMVNAAIRRWQWVATESARVLAGIAYRVEGWENVPEGACIIAAKHQSAWETCLLHVLFFNPAIVLKIELTRIPVWGWFAKASGLIPIDRKGGVKSLAVMRKATADAVADGRKIVIFPQGTRIKPLVRAPYKVGVAAMYQDVDLPVVPMALNSGLFWSKGSFWKKPGTITVRFLPPIPAGLSRSVMMRRLQEELETASDDLARNP
ncbi:MAG: lysophospholipid acyltransferase family protein [Alphaproteobacteria bacterium]|nr:lysophospholipid acyltransferase family protein [Alphaproteobacteria bacterium]